MEEESQVLRATIGMARLAGPERRPTAEASESDPLTRFMYEQLGCIVMDPPWDTSMTWADAQVDLPEIAEADRDRAVAKTLIRLYDEGLAYFFEIEDFGESYERTPTDDEKLDRERLVQVVGVGSSAEDDRISAPMVGVRATSSGKQVHFERRPQDESRARLRR